ncbi:MAG: hypothetical protein LBG30_07840 [Odoribacteraceae bacterium]|nr:hypothetical protein [Odoribacteraceae bacterium]
MKRETAFEAETLKAPCFCLFNKERRGTFVSTNSTGDGPTGTTVKVGKIPGKASQEG